MKQKINGLKNLMLHSYCILTEPKKMPSLPISVQIESSCICNLKCPHCLQGQNAIKSSTGLKPKHLIEILCGNPYIVNLNLTGIGEPLMNPYIEELVKIASNKNIQVGFYTNGLMMNEKRLTRLINNGLNWLVISLDACSPEIYEKVRPGSNFSSVLKVIKMTRQSLPKNVGLSFVAYKENVHEISNLPNFLAKTGIQKISITTPHTWGNQDCISLKKKIEHERLVLKEVGRISNRISFFEFFIPDRNSNRACKMPWSTAYVTCQGEITPCCRWPDSSDMTFGRILDDGWQAWKGEKITSFREALKKDKKNKVCKGCPFYYKSFVI